MNSSQELEWLVDRRSKIQKFLLALHTFLESNPNANSIEASALLQLLLGTGFSLWRAVFLADRERDEKNIESNAKDFLLLLIKDNAINYPQDIKTRAWSSGYYVNNAYFRLGLAYEKLSLDTNLAQKVRSYLIEQRGTSIVPNLTDAWDNAYSASTEILSNLSTK